MRQPVRDFLPAGSLILCVAAILVPRSLRAEWLEDWNSELWYVREGRSETRRQRSEAETLRFCAGAFKDGAWLRRDRLRTQLAQPILQRSAAHCLLSLAAIAALVAWPFFFEPQFFDVVVSAHGFIVGQSCAAAMALMVVPATTSFTRGNYWASRSPGGTARLRRWSFLSAKFGLLTAIGSTVFLYVTLLPQGQVLLADITTIGYVLAFHWALIDQRRRCPVCLRLLSGCTIVGHRSRILVESCTIEYSCPRGHGSVSVPETETSFGPIRWRERDVAPAIPAN